MIVVNSNAFDLDPPYDRMMATILAEVGASRASRTRGSSSPARAVLCEAAWNNQATPKVGQRMQERCPPVSQDIVALAWKA